MPLRSDCLVRIWLALLSLSFPPADLTKALPDIITKHKLTMLIPNDAAFAKIPSSTLKSLLKKPLYLRQLVYLHMLRGTWNADGLCKKPQGYPVSSNMTFLSSGKCCFVW